MSIKTLAHIVNQVFTNPNLSGNDKVVAATLAFLLRDNTGYAWPTFDHLADACGMDRRVVLRCVRRLEKAGLILVTHSPGRHSNQYSFPPFNSDKNAPVGNSDKNAPVGRPTVTKLHLFNSDKNAPTHHVSKKSKEEEEKDMSKIDSNDVQKIFDFWRTTMHHPDAKLTGDRRRVIGARLADGYSVDQICQAITGCSKSAFHMGDNDRNRTYDGLHLICRSGEKLEEFQNMSQRTPAPKTKSTPNWRAELNHGGRGFVG